MHRSSPSPLVGESPAMEEVRRFLRLAAGVDAPVLLTGETGTGKSLVARILHHRGSRARGPMVSVNCAGIPESLFESELFGHERGAFTGAHQTRKGLFELAEGGTLFLDEVGDLPRSQQAKLLAVLEEREIRRVGGSQPIRVDVRVVSATSRNLPDALGDERFRRDLFHRLAVLRLTLPPLRERSEDIPVLADHILERVARKHGWSPPRPGAGVEEYLRDRSWPGNVRELAHVLEAGLILAQGRALERTHLVAAAGFGSSAPSERYSFYGSREEERELIRRTLERCKGNKSRAARELGMSRNTLRSRIRRFDLE